LITLALSEVMIVSELLEGVTHKSPVFAITSDVAEGYGTYFFRAGVKRVDAAGEPIVYGGIQSVYIM